jgi:hypothetical protein
MYYMLLKKNTYLDAQLFSQDTPWRCNVIAFYLFFFFEHSSWHNYTLTIHLILREKMMRKKTYSSILTLNMKILRNK